MQDSNISEQKQFHVKTQQFAVDEFGNQLPVSVDENGEFIEKNAFFFQFNKGTYPAVRKLLLDYPLAGNIFLFMVENMDNTNALMISFQAMSEIFGRTRQCLSKAIKHLKDHNFLDVLKSGNSNVYCLNANIVWHRSRDNIKFAKFKANVYLTYNEQMSKEKKLKKVFSKALK